jgi:DNA-binding XRE family transcriptional regulator
MTHIQNIIREYIAASGDSKSALCRRAGISRMTLCRAETSGTVSPEVAVAIEAAATVMGSEIPRHKLRPDLWPS